MSTVRIQLRRGTATEWTNADTALNASGGLVLAAGEMAVETNTRKIKIGDGTSRWSALSYVASDSPAITEIAQDAIDQALSMGSGLAKSYNDSTNTISISIDDTVVALKSYVDSQVGGLENTVTTDYVLLADVGNAGGPAKLDVDGNLLVPKSSIVLEGATANNFETTLTVVDPTADRTITFPNASGTVALTSDITSAVNGLVDAAPGALDTLNELAAAIGDDANYAAGVTTALGNLTSAGVAHGSATTNVHGIADTAELATESYVDDAETDANIYADSAIGTAMTNHNNDSTDVHGIVDTADLMLKSGSSMTGVLTLNGAPSSDLHASTKKYVDDTKNTHAAVTTNVHGIADTSLLATTANVATAKSEAIAAVTVTSLSLQNVDNTSDVNKPVSTATQTALDLKAPLASPELTGTPTAPTAFPGTNTTQVATTEYVGNAVAALIASAPGTLDTLNELANALGGDENFSTTVLQGLNGKAPLASPTFTGTVTVAAAGVAFTDGTQTKEGVPSRTPIISKVASYTLSAASERDSLIEVNSTDPVTITIPTNSAVAYPIGTTLDILGINTGLITIEGDSGVTVNSTPGLKLRTQWSSCTLFKRAENSWVVYGDLKA